VEYRINESYTGVASMVGCVVGGKDGTDEGEEEEGDGE